MRRPFGSPESAPRGVHPPAYRRAIAGSKRVSNVITMRLWYIANAVMAGLCVIGPVGALGAIPDDHEDLDCEHYS